MLFGTKEEIKFAPIELAKKFSYEVPIDNDPSFHPLSSFGFHGYTFALDIEFRKSNGLGWFTGETIVFDPAHGVGSGGGVDTEKSIESPVNGSTVQGFTGPFVFLLIRIVKTEVPFSYHVGGVPLGTK